jgi:hypothetical protein
MVRREDIEAQSGTWLSFLFNFTIWSTLILSEGDTFSIDETWLSAQMPRFTRPAVALSGVLVGHEKEMIEAALAQTQGRVSGPAGAAVRLGLPAQTLDSKIKRLKINKSALKIPPRFPDPSGIPQISGPSADLSHAVPTHFHWRSGCISGRYSEQIIH